MKKNESKLSKIPRMKFMINALNKKTNSQLREYQKIAEAFNDNLELSNN
jgi:hypothetical protein